MTRAPEGPDRPQGPRARRVSKTSLAAAASLALGLGGVALTACGADDDAKGGSPRLAVSGAYLPQPPTPDIAAGYLSVRNSGGDADRLTSVTTALSDTVTMHTTQGSAMRKVTGFEVPAGGELTLARGGDHLMLEKLTRQPKVGETVTLTLHFASSPAIEVRVPVKPTSYQPED
ncbi:copper chaperone PCu(A)C [Streptomyces sp. NPDC057702]|uniref:copper chaperone PCu(A)C n=1 Tax=unclassified Streptomyces TaxID=2593676 RepID=UPI0036D1CCD2